MAITISGANTTSSTGTSGTVNKPSINVGDILFAWIVRQNSGSVSRPTGWTQIESTYNSNGLHIVTFYKVATYDDVYTTDYTFTWNSSSDYLIVLSRVRGYLKVAPLYVAKEETQDNTANPSFTTLTTTPTRAGTAFYGIQLSNGHTTFLNPATNFAFATDNETWVALSGITDTLLNSSGGYQIRSALTATGALNVTGGVAGSDWSAQLISFTPAIAGELDNFLIEAEGGGAIGTKQIGVPFNIRITARDVDNATVTSFTGTVTITTNGVLSSGSGVTASFVNGVLDSHTITVDSAYDPSIDIAPTYITATRTGGLEFGSAIITTEEGFDLQQHEGNIYTPVEPYPFSSTIQKVIIFCAPNSSVSGSRKEAAVKLYFNMSTTPFATKYVTRNDIQKGYVVFEVNKQYVNSMQFEIEYFNAENPNPEGLYSLMNEADFCPMYAEVIYKETTTGK